MRLQAFERDFLKNILMGSFFTPDDIIVHERKSDFPKIFSVVFSLEITPEVYYKVTGMWVSPENEIYFMGPETGMIEENTDSEFVMAFEVEPKTVEYPVTMYVPK